MKKCYTNKYKAAAPAGRKIFADSHIVARCLSRFTFVVLASLSASESRSERYVLSPSRHIAMWIFKPRCLVNSREQASYTCEVELCCHIVLGGRDHVSRFVDVGDLLIESQKLPLQCLTTWPCIPDDTDVIHATRAGLRPARTIEYSSSTPLLRPPSKSDWSGRKRGVVVHEGLDYFISCALWYTHI